jgi:flavin reductase (DIM6/NTAB) family NADH-FMN oxidoreductase RutF
VSQARELRNAFGRFASGVTVVTTRHDGHTYGMTANSFVSVSLEPPLVLVSVDHKAHLHRVLPLTGRYGVSVLAENQHELSTHFAGRGPAKVDVSFFDLGGVPLIQGALAHFVAEVTDAHLAGDHTLYIARVEHFEFRDGRPLVFHSGRYHQLNGTRKLSPSERSLTRT